MFAPRQPSVGLLLPPVLISFVAFVLAVIALLAGTGPQEESLEPYHIIAVNVSNFGQDLIKSAASSDSEPSDKDDDGGSWFDNLIDDAHDLGDDITDGINNITNGIADDLIEEIGISQWYSLHVMTACEGMFAPNVSNPGAWYNLTNCTSQQASLRLNLSEILDHEIKAGPLSLNINQIPIPKKVQDAVDIVNDALLALLVFYALAIGLSGLSFLASLAVLVVLRKKVSRPVVWVQVGIAGLAALVLLIASAIVTYVNNKGVQEINDAGKDVGISGIKGTKFITLSWVAFALMLVTTLYWGLALLKSTQRWIILADSSRRHEEKTLPY